MNTDHLERMKRADGSSAYAVVDDDGGLRLPPEVVRALGLKPGARAYLESGEDALLLHRPVSHLARVYVEPTSRCNMDCQMCIRHSWQDSQGDMEAAVFGRLLEGLKTCSPRPSVIFGGFGEPLVHPDIKAMLAACKELGCRVELITNGLLLDEDCSRHLVGIGLDRVWVSLDSGQPEPEGRLGYGGFLEMIKRSLHGFNAARSWSSTRDPKLGVVFVATRQNVSEMAQVYRLAGHHLADRFLVTNLLAHTEEMTGQVLYHRSQWNWRGFFHKLALPRIDAEQDLFDSLQKMVRRDEWTSFLGHEFARLFDTCPFIERGSLAVRWDGQVSPCLPLLHDYDSYLGGTRRRNRSYFPGSLETDTLLSIWNDAEYTAFRTRVREFDFPPCTSCNSCELAEANEEDCFGNPKPTCGGCLWAQWFIRCP